MYSNTASKVGFQWAYVTKTNVKTSRGIFVSYSFGIAATLEKFVQCTRFSVSQSDAIRIERKLVFAVQCPNCKLIESLVFEQFKDKVYSWFDVQDRIRGLTEKDVYCIKRIASEHGEIWDYHKFKLLTELINPN